MSLNCAFCSQGKTTFLFEASDYWSNESFNWYLCKSCKIEFISPQPEVQKLEKYYQNESGSAMRGSSSLIHRKLKSILLFSEVRKVIGKRKPRSTSQSKLHLIDIGTGSGMLASVAYELLQSQGGSVSAADYYPEEHWQRMHQKPISYFQANIAEIGENPEFWRKLIKQNHINIVVMRHVLEHLPSPRKTLKALHTAGIQRVEITVPLQTSFFHKLHGKYDFLLDSPRHLYFFSEKALIHLVNSEGWNIRGLEYGGLDTLFPSLRNYLFKKGDIKTKQIGHLLLGPTSFLSSISSIFWRLVLSHFSPNVISLSLERKEPQTG